MAREGRINGITEGVIWKQLLLFFFPILLGTFFQQFYSTVDTIIVGRYVGKNALAAIGVTGPLVNLLVGFFTGLASGAGVVISQAFGGRENERVSRGVHTALALSVVLGAVFTVVGILLAPGMLVLMNTPAEVLDQSIAYLQVYFAGMIPTLIYNMGTAILRSVGDSKRPLYFLIAASLLNVVLDFLFVLGFDMGVVGAAWGTVLSQVLAAVLVALCLCRSAGTPYYLQLRAIRIHGDVLPPMLRVGLPAGFQSVMYTVSNLIIQAAINKFGTDVIAAWTVYGKIDSIFWMALSSMGLAITTFAGQNFGARQYGRIHRGLAVSVGMSAVITLLCSVLFLAFGEPIFLLFNNDPAVVREGMAMVRFLVPCYFTYLCIEVFSGALRGCGDSVMPTVMTCLGVCVLRVAWVWFAVPLQPTVQMVLVSYPITWTTTSVCYLIYSLRGKWLKRRIRAVRAEEAAPVCPE